MPAVVPVRGLGAVLLAALAIAGTVAGPAQAHPFGPPQTVSITRDGTDPAVVRVRWSPGAVDDLSLLRDFLRDGHVDPAALAKPTSVTLGEAAEAAHDLPAMASFRDYVRRHIELRASGVPCPSAMAPIEHLAADGATLVFTCPAPVATAQVRITTLTDLHPAYKTFATGPGGVKAVYDVAHPSHTWSTDAAATAGDQAMTSSAGRSAALQLAVTGGGLLAAVALIVCGLRWRRRKVVAA